MLSYQVHRSIDIEKSPEGAGHDVEPEDLKTEIVLFCK